MTSNTRKALILAASVLALASAPAAAAPTLSAYWTDHAVIQRDAPVTVEGSAQPGETVTGVLGQERQQVRAGKDGRFTLQFAPRKAGGGPLTLQVGDRTISDLLVGDVWLCSGQSNMEYSVSRALNGPGVVMSSADDGLRLLEVPKGSTATPQARFTKEVSWQAAGPDSVGGFSAACYFMARELREARGVPIGAINASFGGSQARVWLAPKGAEALYGKEQIAMLQAFDKDPLGTVTRFAPGWEALYRDNADGSTPWNAPDSLTWSPVPKIAVWNDWGDPQLSQNPVGTVWLRRTIDLTPAQAKAGATLSLGIIDEIDMTFVNGHPVGNSFGWDFERNYRVPSEFLHPGRNEIMVAATNTWSTGGFSSPADKLALTPTGMDPIALGEGWRYSRAPMAALPPRSPWDMNAGLGVRHNAMVAPLGHVALEGAAWYQGESDVDLPGYRDRMRELFAGWRSQFSPDMRMLVVQLANYGPVQTRPAPSGWAALREDQRQAVLADSNAALVTAIDIGEQTDIHPANKQVLGHRLALAAQGKAMPQPTAAVAGGTGYRIRFSGVEGGLVALSAAGPIAFELCGATQESCRYASARMDGSDVVIAGDGMAATRIRYAWADSPVVNAYDAAAMPLPGFEIAIAPR